MPSAHRTLINSIKSIDQIGQTGVGETTAREDVPENTGILPAKPKQGRPRTEFTVVKVGPFSRVEASGPASQGLE